MSDDTCSDCGAPVRHVFTEGGTDIALDVDPHPDGNVIAVQVDGRTLARVLTPAQLPATQPAWQRHSQTCPESPAARARRAKRAPRCRACDGPLDEHLAQVEPHDTHPVCDPAAAAALVRHAATRGA